MVAGDPRQQLDTPLEDESFQDRERRYVLGVRASALLEMALFLAVFLVVDRSLLGGNALWDVTPHPLWILVLLVSVQYGTTEGILAAGLAALVLLGSHIPPQELEQDFYVWIFELSRRPLMWFVAAVVLGELRMRQFRVQRDVEARLAESEEREVSIGASYERLERLKDDLEARVAGQMRTVISMYEAARSMEHLDPAEVERGLMNAVGEAMSPRKYSLFLVEKDGLRLSLQEGWEADDGYARAFRGNSGLFNAVVGQRRSLAVSRTQDEAILQGEGLLAGPLVSDDSGEVVGMLKIESLGFTGMTVTAVRNFEVLCAWVGMVYGNARRYQDARESSLVSDRGNLFSAGFFERQQDFLIRLARRQKFALTQIDVAVANFDELPRDNRELAPAALSEAVEAVLRTTDLAFDHHNNGRDFAIILPATPVANADQVVEKLMADLDERVAGRVEGVRWQVGIRALHQVAEEAADG